MPADELHSVLDLLTLPIPAFVEASYDLLLGRHAAPEEVAERAGSLRAGLGRLRFLADLSESAEYRRRQAELLRGQGDVAFLEDLYERYLGRPIDPQGMTRYLRLLARGKSRRRIRRNIAGSREARAKRTLWFELDRLIADEQAERHWLRRWSGRSRRQERRENRMQEALLRHRPEVSPPAFARAPQDAGATLPEAHSDAFAGLSREALDVLARARQAARGGRA
ncbi:MAG TPA: hypothetical protein VMQ93_20650 [Novosphingobium sp.]|nr:hypothetical protein [Novosphingobium sp.]